jgi:hypothetical protein
MGMRYERKTGDLGIRLERRYKRNGLDSPLARSAQALFVFEGFCANPLMALRAGGG